MIRWPLLFLIASCLCSLTAAPNTVILVRHAEKEAAGADPALTPAGAQRARLLARMLREVNVSAVFASDKLRTQQTAAATADMRKLKPVVVPSSDVPALSRKILAQSGDAVLVVGHSNTLPQIIKALGGQSAPSIDESEYDRFFVLTLRPGQPPVLVVLRYGAEAHVSPTSGAR